MEKINVDAEYNQIPHRIELLQKEQSASLESLMKWRNAELEKLQAKIGETVKEIEAIGKQRKLLTDQRDKELENVRKTFEKQKKGLKDTCDQQKAEVNAELKNKEQSTAGRKGELLAQMDAELKGLGVDVNQLATIRQQLQKVSDELKYIEDHRPGFISWQNDTREYFEQEQRKKDERKQLRQKIDDLQEKFDKRKKQYDEKIGTLSADLRKLQDE